MPSRKKAVIEITAEDRTARQLKQLSRNLENTSRKMGAIGRGMTSALTLPLAGLGVAAVKIGGDFDKAMRNVNSLLALPQGEFEALKGQARDLSSELGVNLKGSAEALYSAISAGVPKDNAIDFLRVASKAAIGGATDTETAVDGLTTALNAFKIPAAESERVAGIFLKTVERGKTTFGEFSDSLFQVAPTANAMGISLEEVAGATATLTKSGTPTSVAMTQLRSTMVALTKPTKEMEGLLEKMGFQTGDAAIEALGFKGTLDALTKAAGGNKTELAKALGSVEGLSAVLGLTGSNAKTFADDLKAVADSSTALTEKFEENNKGSARAIEKLLAKLQGLASVVGDVLAPYVEKAAEIIGKLADKVSAADPALVAVGIAVAGVVAAIGPLLLILAPVVSALGTVSAAMAAAGGAGALFASGLAVITGPIGLTVAAIVAGAALIIANWDQVKAFAIQFTGQVSAAFLAWKERNAETISGITESIMSIWESLQVAGQQIAAFVVAAVADIDSFLGPIGGLKGAFEILKVAVGTTLDQLAANVGTAFGIVADIFKGIADVLSGNKTLWEAYRDTVNSVLERIIGLIKGWVERVKAAFLAIDLKGIGKNIMDGLTQGIQDGAKNALSAISNVAESVKSKFSGALKIFSPSRVFKGYGRDIIAGLALGIASSAVAAEDQAELAAVKTLAAFERGISKQEATTQARLQKALGKDNFAALSGGGQSFGGQQQLGGFGGQPDFGGGFGGGFESIVIPGEKELEETRAFYDQYLAVLSEKGQQGTQLALAIEGEKAKALMDMRRQQVAGYGASFDSILQLTEAFGGQQSGIYKGLFAVSKGFAIAESIIAIQQNIAKASAIGFPQNIPFIAGAVAQGASIVSTIKGTQPSFEGGGYTGAGARTGGVDGKGGFNAVLHPNEQVIDMQRGQSASSSVTVNLTINGDPNPSAVAQIKRDSVRLALETQADVNRRGGGRAAAFR